LESQSFDIKTESWIFNLPEIYDVIDVIDDLVLIKFFFLFIIQVLNKSQRPEILTIIDLHKQPEQFTQWSRQTIRILAIREAIFNDLVGHYGIAIVPIPYHILV